MTIENPEQVKESIPILQTIVNLTDDNKFMADIHNAALQALTVAKRCVSFGIYRYNNYLGFGKGIFIMKNINDERYDPEHPEELLKISFPEGPLIFGKRRDMEYFNDFFKALQEVEPDYIEPANHALYYKPEKAAKAWEHYEKTIMEYMDGNVVREKAWRLEQAIKEYERLKAEVESET